MWTNLGYWNHAAEPGETLRDSGNYPTAARELARRVGTAAQLRRDDVVLDYACGYGDSLRLWVEEFGVRRVIGVEPDPALCALVTARIEAWGLGDRVRIHCAAAEQALPRQIDEAVSAVVCVDAAYHFVTRAEWLRNVADALPAGGRVAFSDLLWESSRRLGPLAPFLARTMRVAPRNLGSEGALLAELRSCGLDSLNTERCGRAVLDGFARHAPRGSLAVTVTRTALRWLRRGGRLDYVVTAAIQPIAPRSAIRG